MDWQEITKISKRNDLLGHQAFFPFHFQSQKSINGFSAAWFSELCPFLRIRAFHFERMAGKREHTGIGTFLLTTTSKLKSHHHWNQCNCSLFLLTWKLECKFQEKSPVVWIILLWSLFSLMIKGDFSNTFII